MQQPPVPAPSQPPRRGLSAGAKVAVALLAIAVVAASAFAFAALRRTQDLERRLAEQEPTPDPEQPDEGPLGDLFEDGEFGDLFGEGGPFGGGSDGSGSNLLRCLVGENGIGGLFGGGLGGALGGGSSGSSDKLSGRQLVRRTSSQVEKLRRLRFKHEVEAKFLSGPELGDRISELFLQDYSLDDAQKEVRLLSLLGVVPPDTNMRELRSSALEGQVAGFYVPQSEELVVRAYSGDIGALEKVTFAHELEHALADQNLGLPVEERAEAATADADLAATAVVEGDATLVMQQYSLRHLSLEDQASMLGNPRALQRSQRQLESLPYYLQQELMWPYVEGLNFVCDLFIKGGWKAVNRAYDRLPGTTDQILWPDRYDPDAEPRDPEDSGDLGTPWRKELSGSLGAAELMWLFGAPGDDVSKSLDDPRAAAGAWAGGEIELWAAGDRSAAGISLVERKGEGGLCAAVSEWYGASFENDEPAPARGDEELTLDGATQDGVLSCSGDDVRLGIGPNLSIARMLTS
ncbi:MAG: hypothetical protein ACRDKZ_16300 [Actinomycetota bacterium]